MLSGTFGALRRQWQANDRAIELDPVLAAPYYERGNVPEGLGRLVEALADFDKAIALKPDDAIAHSNRGTTLVDLGRFAEAFTSLISDRARSR